jgi:hypothetical protein
VFAVNNAEYMRIDTAGNVGIGTATPIISNKLTVMGGGVQFSGGTSSQAGLRIQYTSGASTITGINQDNNAYNPIAFYTGAAETMRLDSSGNWYLGTTTNLGKMTMVWASATQAGLAIYAGNSTFTGSPIVFYNSVGGVSGYIGQATSTITYNTSSDYRLKENVRPLTSSIDTINALNPVAYDWKIDSTYGEGFIAHEVQEHIPLAVTGEKDAVDEEGKMKPQAVDYSKIVVHLVAAMQEQQKQIEELKNKISILEAK